MWLAENWKDYECLDTKNGEKLERWGDIMLVRPDPQVIWNKPFSDKGWNEAHGHYFRSNTGGGQWKFFQKMPESWTVHYKELSFQIKPMNFKHTGLFPEQAVNWDWIIEKLKDKPHARVLNLFAYTGGATVAAAYAGADVVHVDASKGMVSWAKENLKMSGLEDRFVRFIVDDCLKFVEREIRRGRKYEAIIMDPPSYGRGPGGEVWKIENNLYPFIEKCTELLSDEASFMLINSYTTGLSPVVMKNTMNMLLGGKIESDEIGLPITRSGMILPCGSTCRWEG